MLYGERRAGPFESPLLYCDASGTAMHDTYSVKGVRRYRSTNSGMDRSGQSLNCVQNGGPNPDVRWPEEAAAQRSGDVT
jgi:hypothetical protein